jgi:outer membrane protein OmpA-like peptidoglycan-associated protein
MIKAGRHLIWIASTLLIFGLVNTGCASKKYVNAKVAPVNQRLTQYEKKTDDRIAWLNNKEQTDVSQLNERIATTDQKASEAASAAQEAQGSASRAMEEAGSVKTANEEAISRLESSVDGALNYQLKDKADVMFAFNKATLSSSARSTLDEIADKCQSTPRAVVELEGFTDHVGSSEYNMALSRRRAWAVQRYLVEHKVPPRSIHIVGMGEARPGEGFEPETLAKPKNERNRMERRVNIRVFAAGEIGPSNPGQ